MTHPPRSSSVSVEDGGIPAGPPGAARMAARALFLSAVVCVLAAGELGIATWNSSPSARHGALRTLDPNTAPWHELAILPRIGPTLARAIVDRREARRAAGDNRGEPVFLRVSDLDAIRGIGPVTLQRIGPHLRFPSDNSKPPTASP